MNKKGLVSKVTDVLKNNNIRKPVSMPRHVFHISDDEGNQKDFAVKKTDKTVAYNSADVSSIIDACLFVIEDSIKRGEPVYLHGFGVFDIYKRAARQSVHPDTHERVNVEARYVPKFTYGAALRTAAKIYQSTTEEFSNDIPFTEHVPETKDGDS